MRIILASSNSGKKAEIARLLPGYTILGLHDIGYSKEIIEDGVTFIENADIKVNAIKNIFHDDFILGDDSGLMIESLNGLPGINTRRWAGEKVTESYIRQYCLKQMKKLKNLDDRRANFVCVFSLYNPISKKIKHFTGKLSGYIAQNEGENMEIEGLSYGPIFLLKDKKTYLSEIHINKLPIDTHRSLAMKRLVNELNKINNK